MAPPKTRPQPCATGFVVKRRRCSRRFRGPATACAEASAKAEAIQKARKKELDCVVRAPKKKQTAKALMFPDLSCEISPHPEERALWRARLEGSPRGPWFETPRKSAAPHHEVSVCVTPFHPRGSAEGRCLTRNDELRRFDRASPCHCELHEANQGPHRKLDCFVARAPRN